jgi:serine/threonine protein kinase
MSLSPSPLGSGNDRIEEPGDRLTVETTKVYTVPPAVVASPERLGDFRIVREIGRGGMGVVYEAEQLSLGRHVALKVLPAQTLRDPRQLQRFQIEARAAGRLHHTNIVPVYGVGEQGGTHYYVMQFIRGQGLDQLLQKLCRIRQAAETKGQPLAGTIAETVIKQAARALGPAESSPRRPDPSASANTPPEARGLDAPSGPRSGSRSSVSGHSYWHSVAQIGLQAADALAYAHGQGVLHRDIKPSNLLLDERGTVWVTDFGLAKIANSGDLTGPGAIIGTPRYMAPERFRGHADARSDIYALGLTLYELIALRPVFDESDHTRLLLQVLEGDLPSLRQLIRDVPRDLDTIICKAVARDPEQRYQTAADFAEDLRSFVEDRPIRARPLRLHERWWRWCRRNPLTSALVAAIAVLLVATSIAASFAAYRFGVLADHERAAREAVCQNLHRLDVVNASLEQARLATERGRWTEARDALAEAERMQPGHALVAHERRRLHLLLGLYAEAAEDLRGERTAAPADARFDYRWACLLLHGGDAAGYRLLCEKMLLCCDTDSPADDALWTARACTLAPGAVADLDQPVRLARKAVAANEGNRLAHAVLAVALYRAGHLAEARRELERSERPNTADRPTVALLSIAALLHPAPQARVALERADRRISALADDVYDEEERHYRAWSDELLDGPLLFREAVKQVRGIALSNHPGLYRARGLSYSALGEWDKAAACYRDMRRLNSPRADLFAGEERRGTADLARRPEVLTRLVDLLPDDGDLRRLLAISDASAKRR